MRKIIVDSRHRSVSDRLMRDVLEGSPGVDCGRKDRCAAMRVSTATANLSLYPPACRVRGMQYFAYIGGKTRA
jgi:hypothetical protein